MVSRLIIVLAFCTVTTAAPIIRVKTVNGQKKSYCCYGVVRPFDMSAKAKQGLRALNQVGFNLKKLRTVLDIHEKAVTGKLENAEKEAEDLNKRVQKALQAVMKILSDATKKAAKTLSEVSEATNDLGQLGKDIRSTKTYDMITKIREMIARKPTDEENDKEIQDKAKLGDKKPADKKPEGTKSKDSKSNGIKSSRDKTAHGQKSKDKDKEAKPTTVKQTTRKDQGKDKKKHKSLRPKDRIPGANRMEKGLEAQRLLDNAAVYENEQVERARDDIEKRTEDSKRAMEKAKDFLRRVEDGLLQVQNGIEEAGIEVN